MSILLSVIIVNYNGQALLESCLKSLVSSSLISEMEIVLVDNASNDNSVEWVKKHFPAVKVVVNKKNLGYSAANNVGINVSTGKYILLLNNDTELLADGLKAVCQKMEDHPDIGILGCKLVNPDQTLQLSCRSFPGLETALFSRYSILTQLFPHNPFSQKYLMNDFSHDQERNVDWVSGAAMLIRRELIDRIGNLDEDYHFYCEDVDYCFRAWKKGWKVIYCPECSFIHYVGKTSGSTLKRRLRAIAFHHHSMFTYYKKHYSRHFFLLDCFVLSAIVLRWSILSCMKVIREVRPS